MRRLLIGLAAVSLGALVLFIALVELVTDGKPFPMDGSSMANLAIAERLFAADYPGSGAMELPCIAMQRHVTKEHGSTRLLGWPSGDRPVCSDYLFIRTPAEHGRLLDAVACGPVVAGVPKETRHSFNRDVFVARLPGGRPAVDYFDPESGRPAAWAMPRLAGATGAADNGMSAHFDLVRMGLTSVTGCEGFELIEIGTEYRD